MVSAVFHRKGFRCWHRPWSAASCFILRPSCSICSQPRSSKTEGAIKTAAKDPFVAGNKAFHLELILKMDYKNR